MSLKTIAAFVATEAGIPFTTDDEKAYLYDRVDRAALELYVNNDLPNSLKEVYMSLQCDASEIFTFPCYVGQVRGIRRAHYDERNASTFTGPSHRYQKQTWGGISLDNVRIVGNAATSRDIEEEQPITLNLSKAQTKEVKVILTGTTHDDSSEVVEVVFPAGSTTQTFSSLFTEINSVTKEPFFYSSVKGFEETVMQDPLFEIESDQTTSNYLKVHVQDLYNYRVSDRQYNFELLYKPRYRKMWSPYSEFMVPQVFDQCIAWWTISQYAKTSDEAAVYMNKVSLLLANINEDESRGRKICYNIGYNKHAETYERLIEYVNIR